MKPRPVLPLLLVLACSTGAARADLRLVDDGVRTRQIVTDGSTLYVLKDSGEVWRNRHGRFDRLDDGSGTRMLAAADGKLFLLKDSGRIFEHTGGRSWRMIDDGTRSRSITTSNGRLYLLKDSGNIHRFDGRRWDRIDDGTGTKQIAARGTSLYVLKENGNVWRYDDRTRRFDKVDPGTRTRAIAPTDQGVAILKESGELWQERFGDFDRLATDPDLVELAAAGDHLYTRTRQGRVTRYDLRWGDRRSVPSPPRDDVKGLAATPDGVYLLQRSGNVWRHTTSPWAPVASAGAAFDRIYAGD